MFVSRRGGAIQSDHRYFNVIRPVTCIYEVFVFDSFLIGLPENIVSGSMEYSLKRRTISNDADVFSNHGVLSIDPMHYMRRGKPFTSHMPSSPSSWMEQWPIG